jgi:hypothetical protein
MQYRVSWEIDIEAGSPEKAAAQALAIQRDPESTATTFDVELHGACPKCRQSEVHKKRCPVYTKGGFRGVAWPHRIDAAHTVSARRTKARP